jgi:gluconate 2-dehydrogenase gamma chain
MEPQHTHTVTRRDALKAFVTGVGAVMAAPVLSESAWAQALAVREQAASATTAGLKFFTPAQHHTVDVLSELIIPADAHSPGASAAKVADFIDLLLSGAVDVEQAAWRDGLAALDAAATGRFVRPFAACTPEQQTTLLTEISKNEANPQTPVEQLFVYAKERTIQGYYTSDIGIHKELGYRGNQFLNEFLGCTHPEHGA